MLVGLPFNLEWDKGEIKHPQTSLEPLTYSSVNLEFISDKCRVLTFFKMMYVTVHVMVSHERNITRYAISLLKEDQKLSGSSRF